jgi:clan AA aspartic protease
VIQGTRNPNREAIVSIAIRNDNSGEVTTEAVVDTGFNGYISLTREVIERLQLSPFSTAERLLADGTRAVTNLYIARIVWHGRELIVAAEDVEDTCLIGMELLLDNLATFDVRNGGPVTITQNPVP